MDSRAASLPLLWNFAGECHFWQKVRKQITNSALSHMHLIQYIHTHYHHILVICPSWLDSANKTAHKVTHVIAWHLLHLSVSNRLQGWRSWSKAKVTWLNCFMTLKRHGPACVLFIGLVYLYLCLYALCVCVCVYMGPGCFVKWCLIRPQIKTCSRNCLTESGVKETEQSLSRSNLAEISLGPCYLCLYCLSSSFPLHLCPHPYH